MFTTNRIAATLLTLMLAVGTAQAAKDAATTDAPAAKAPPTGQQAKMSACSKEAREKTLKGDERKSFMRECLSSKKAAK